MVDVTQKMVLELIKAAELYLKAVNIRPANLDLSNIASSSLPPLFLVPVLKRIMEQQHEDLSGQVELIAQSIATLSSIQNELVVADPPLDLSKR